MNLDYNNNIQIQELLQVMEVINNERFQIGQIFFPLHHHQISHRHQDLQTTLPNICTILEGSLHNRWLIIQNTFFNAKTYSPISIHVLYSNILDFPLCKLYSNHTYFHFHIVYLIRKFGISTTFWNQYAQLEQSPRISKTIATSDECFSQCWSSKNSKFGGSVNRFWCLLLFLGHIPEPRNQFGFDQSKIFLSENQTFLCTYHFVHFSFLLHYLFLFVGQCAKHVH